MNVDLKDVAKLSKSLYYDKSKMFDGVSGDKIIRNLVFDALDMDQDSTAIDWYKWEANKIKVFEIISVAVDAVVPTVLTNQLDNLAEVRNIATGDEIKFTFEDDSLFRVGLVSAGNNEARRQELYGGSYTVDTDWYSVKVYAEFEKFIAGHINWQEYINRVAKSFANHLQTRIADAFQKSYSTLRATRKHTGTFDKDELLNISRHIKTATGNKPVAVYGTTTALSKVSDHAMSSEKTKDAINEVGYVGKLFGLPLIALPDAYQAGTEEFALSDNTLLILPQNEKLVSVALEGQTIATDKDSTLRNDLQIEFETRKKYGVQVAQAAVYGMYELN